MDAEWLYALARFRAGLADRGILTGPTLTQLEHASDTELELHLRILDLAEDKSARSEEIVAADNGLLRARNLRPPDQDDCRWIAAYGLAEGAFDLKPYALAHFLGSLPQWPDHNHEVRDPFLVAVDDIDDGYLDRDAVEADILQTFTEARPALHSRARSRFEGDPRTASVMNMLTNPPA